MEIKGGKILANMSEVKPEYDALRETYVKHNLIIDMLFSTAKLSWDGNDLDFDTHTLAKIMRTVYRARYMAVLFGLKEDKEGEKA